MFVVWRGWGILGALYVVVALFGSLMFEFEFFPGARSQVFSVCFGITMLLAAVATWFTGTALNRTRPQRQINLWALERRVKLDEKVDNGTFSLGPGQPQPASEAEAQHMADHLLAWEVSEATKLAVNRHTLFFAPMQYFGRARELMLQLRFPGGRMRRRRDASAAALHGPLDNALMRPIREAKRSVYSRARPLRSCGRLSRCGLSGL